LRKDSLLFWLLYTSILNNLYIRHSICSNSTKLYIAIRDRSVVKMLDYPGKLLFHFILISVVASFHPLQIRIVPKTALQVISSYDATFDPVVGSTAAAILLGFGYVQVRIASASRILEQVEATKWELLKVKSLELEGDKQASKSRFSLEEKIVYLEKEYTNLLTFFSVSGVSFRFRVSQQNSTLTEEQKQEEGVAAIRTAAIDMNSKGNRKVAESNVLPQTQIGIGIGVVLIASLLSLFNVLLYDPMADVSGTQRRDTQSLFNIPPPLVSDEDSEK
jgi:hypothetical protein